MVALTEQRQRKRERDCGWEWVVFFFFFNYKNDSKAPTLFRKTPYIHYLSNYISQDTFVSSMQSNQDIPPEFHFIHMRIKLKMDLSQQFLRIKYRVCRTYALVFDKLRSKDSLS